MSGLDNDSPIYNHVGSKTGIDAISSFEDAADPVAFAEDLPFLDYIVGVIGSDTIQTQPLLVQATSLPIFPLLLCARFPVFNT